jgi:hypothetical protein
MLLNLLFQLSVFVGCLCFLFNAQHCVAALGHSVDCTLTINQDATVGFRERDFF